MWQIIFKFYLNAIKKTFSVKPSVLTKNQPFHDLNTLKSINAKIVHKWKNNFMEIFV